MKTFENLHELLKFRNGLSILVSREFEDNKTTPIYEFVSEVWGIFPPAIDYLILGSCSLMMDFLEIIRLNSEYMRFADEEIIEIWKNDLKYFQIEICKYIISKTRNVRLSVDCRSVEVPNNQFHLISALNEYFSETSNYLNNFQSVMSSSISLSMFSEFFSNCGVSEFSFIDTEWMYSADLSNACTEIISKKLIGSDLLKYGSEKLLRINRELLVGRENFTGQNRRIVPNKEHQFPIDFELMVK